MSEILCQPQGIAFRIAWRSPRSDSLSYSIDSFVVDCALFRCLQQCFELRRLLSGEMNVRCLRSQTSADNRAKYLSLLFFVEIFHMDGRRCIVGIQLGHRTHGIEDETDLYP